MSLISLEDARLAAIRSQAAKAQSLLRPSIGAIYWGRPNNMPKQCGSCVFIAYGGHDFIVTANHVFDERKNGALFIGSSTTVIPLATSFVPFFDRKAGDQDDLCDLAFAHLPEGMKTQLGPIMPLEVHANTDHIGAIPTHRYMVLGFPSSKNNRSIGGRRLPPLRDWAFCTRPKANQTMHGRPRIHPQTHIVLDWASKDTMDDFGNDVAPPAPQGMSGGGVFDLGDFWNVSLLGGVSAPPPKLVGISLRWLKSETAILAFRLNGLLGRLPETEVWPS